MSANQAGNPSSTTRPGSVENEQDTFRRYNDQKPFSLGLDKMETTGSKIPGQGYVVGEVCQMGNPFPLHPRRECEDLEDTINENFITLV